MVSRRWTPRERQRAVEVPVASGLVANPSTISVPTANNTVAVYSGHRRLDVRGRFPEGTSDDIHTPRSRRRADTDKQSTTAPKHGVCLVSLRSYGQQA